MLLLENNHICTQSTIFLKMAHPVLSYSLAKRFKIVKGGNFLCLVNTYDSFHNWLKCTFHIQSQSTLQYMYMVFLFIIWASWKMLPPIYSINTVYQSLWKYTDLLYFNYKQTTFKQHCEVCLLTFSISASAALCPALFISLLFLFESLTKVVFS